MGKNSKILFLLFFFAVIFFWYQSSKSGPQAIPVEKTPVQNCSSKCLPDADPPLHFITKGIFKL
ncbi:MAG: hypothetical protein IPO46_07545 [Chitinophagaceae bacterium]|jgi:hypothetical protein|nr:hypothetical protein [Chitinophagaceae bacterium]MBP6046691.1 hypothetical protein [Ferruginibacter sp.]NMD28959.1 hypothetical protein [Bacteroidota bacterium]MBK7088802.1 hypothetical protein [Chitinophagaceae bacterium]MBK7348010.1 hypothetical protein [Chitinophagaceae bacterium]